MTTDPMDAVVEGGPMWPYKEQASLQFPLQLQSLLIQQKLEPLVMVGLVKVVLPDLMVSPEDLSSLQNDVFQTKELMS